MPEANLDILPEVDLDTFASAHGAGAAVIDVREPVEYLDGHVPGARLVPMSQLASRLHEVTTDETVYVVCASGNRSGAMTRLLRHHGVDAVNVRGGTKGWVRSGRPVTSGREA
jgi:rhodanese-related sulfurtransferase